mgnify:CR=1 FL=1
MEKVVVVSGTELKSDRHNSYGPSDDMEAVNNYLDKGWTVKNIHTATTNNITTVIFVLEKEYK